MDLYNLGILTKVRIGCSGKGGSSSWGLDKVVVRELPHGEPRIFPCGRTIEKAESVCELTAMATGAQDEITLRQKTYK